MHTLPDAAPQVVHLTTVHRPFDPRIFYKQLSSARDAGFDTHLVAPHDEDETVHGIPLHALPQPDSRLDRVRLQPRVRQVATDLEASLYQIHDPELLPLGRVLKYLTGASIVYDMHEAYRSKGPLLGRVLRVLERWSFSWLDHVLLAEESYRSLVDDATVDSTVVPNYFGSTIDGVKEQGQDPAPWPDRPRLLYTGTISETRGLATMIDLAREIRANGRPERLELAGICRYAEQRSRADRQIRRYDLGSVVTRLGWDAYVSPPDVWSRYPQGDVGLALFEPHPNYRESIPTKFYECLHYGVPLICSDFPRWNQFVERHGCGATVPPGDAGAVLEVLDRWRADPGQYRRHAENARSAAGRYTWAPVGERLVRVYKSLIGAPERGPEAMGGRFASE